MTRARSIGLESAAETQFHIKPRIVGALKQAALTEEGKKFYDYKYQNYFEIWSATFGDRFFDMSTMIRLGSVIEFELRNLYMRKKGHGNLAALKADRDYKQNIFQRIQPWTTGDCASSILAKVDFDLSATPNLIAAQEVMLHRHLYAHLSGLVDDKYIAEWLKLTGQDIGPDVQAIGYPNDDVYWFRPLGSLPNYIEKLRAFMHAVCSS